MNLLLTLLFVLAAPPQDVTFPDAREAIVDDRAEPYFSLLSPHDMTAKTGKPITGETPEAQQEECRKRYRDAAMDFTDEEKERLRGLVAKLHPHLLKHYPGLAALPWSFITIDTHIEGGLPHTRGDHIVLPDGLIEKLPAPPALLLLAHEQLHVFQRKNPRHGDSLYTQMWGFVRAPKLKGGLWIDARTVVNPDATDLGWAFKAGDRWIWPRVLFKRVPTNSEDILNMPGDFHMAAVELRKSGDTLNLMLKANGEPVVHNLLEIEEYRKTFAGSIYIFHPAEAAADLFTRILMIDFLGSEANPDLDPVRNWFRGNLK